jgi:ferritin-like metal-binding protein YciE
MSASVEQELIRSLKRAHGLETQAMALLDKGSTLAGDDEIGAIYRAHLLQTRQHERFVAERLHARGARPSKALDAALHTGALGLGALTKAAPDTPVQLAMTAFAFEHLEIAAYRMVARLARRAGDAETAAVAERILEQEEAAAELVAGTFDRALERTLGDERTSPVPGVTPIGKPSDRAPESTPTPHPGPQTYIDTPADEPAKPPPGVPAIDSERRTKPPEPGHGTGEVRPYGGDVPIPHIPRRSRRRRADRRGAVRAPQRPTSRSASCSPPRSRAGPVAWKAGTISLVTSPVSSVSSSTI